MSAGLLRPALFFSETELAGNKNPHYVQNRKPVV